MERPSLKDVVEAEGKGTAPHPRFLLAMVVTLVYRPARKLLAGETKSGKRFGRKGMHRFADIMTNLAVDFEGLGDLVASLLARHNAASAFGFFNKTRQNAMNRAVWEESEGLDKSDPDTEFLRSKLFFGLLENDAEFAQAVFKDEWLGQVNHLFDARYPDAPGRALRLAQDLVMKGYRDDALSLLARAVSEETAVFGKVDQIQDARKYLKNLNER